MNIILFSEKENKTFLKNDDRYLHIKKILKLSEGESFKAGIINGKIGEAVITEFSSEKLVFTFKPDSKSEALPKIKLILGFPRPIQLRRILRDAASLGFCELFLTGTELGEKSYLKSNLAAASEIETYLLDGISQAGQTLLPAVSFYNSIKSVLQNLNSVPPFLKIKKVLLDISDNAELLSKLKVNTDEEILIAIGSERGWTDNERNLFQDFGFTLYSMGKRILRTETAVCAALSIISANLNIR